MYIQDFFDGIYCINLRSRKDRWEECETEFARHGLSGVIRVNAVAGIPKSRKNVGTMGLDPAGANFSDRLAGCAGCLLSHLKAIRHARRSSFKKILLLEDDIQFVGGVQEKFEALASQIPDDWKMLYFGGNEKGRQTQVDNNIVRISDMLMTHAVAVNCDLFDELIGILNKMEAPVDVCYTRIQKAHPCYALYPYLAWQRSGWSDIEQRFRIYDLENVSPSLKEMLSCRI